MSQDIRQTILTLSCVTFGIAVVMARDFVKFSQETELAKLEIVRISTASDLNKVYPEQGSHNSYTLSRDAKKKARGSE